MEKQLFSRVFFAFFILERSRSSCVFFIKKACLPAVRTEPLFRQRLWVSRGALAAQDGGSADAILITSAALVLVLFGGVVYAAAVPALIVQNPVIQSVVESVTASRDESADAADSSSQSSGSKSFSSGPVASSNSGGVSFPALGCFFRQS